MEKVNNAEGAKHNYILGQRELAIKVPEYEMIKDYAIWNYMNPFNKKELQYHYTDINGFIGIMNNQELWASNTKFLNDKAEGKEGLRLTKEIITEHLEKGGLNVYFECLNMDLQKVINSGSKEDIYSISFCRESDLLSQWRGYGKNGGIAIGFNFTYKEEEYLGRKSVLPHSFLDRNYYENTEKDDNKFLPQEGEWIHLFQVIYDPKEQRRILDDIICLGSEAVEYYINTRKPSDAIEEIQNISQNIINTIEYFLPLFKNSGFKEENEVRYIWRNDGKRKIYFRERNGIIFPYLRCMLRDLNCQQLNELPIDDIVIGPQINQNEVKESVTYYLQHNNYEYLIDKVRLSDVPYRG